LNESQLIALLFNRDNYTRFKQHLREFSVLPETWEIIEDVGKYYDDYPTDTGVDASKFITWSRVQHPTRTGERRDAYEAMVEVAEATEPDPAIMDRLHELTAAIEIKDKCEDVIFTGKTGKMDEVARLIDGWREVHAKGGHDDPLAPYDLHDIFESLSRTGGLPWRLVELNKSIGPLCRGDLVLIGKRPEVGGTTFLTSEFSHMLEHMDDDGRVVIFNNEESKAKVWARLMQSALNMTVMDMAMNPKDTLETFNEFLGTRQIDVIHDTALTCGKVDAILNRKHYDLIGFNVLWKVRPYGKNLEDFQAYQRVAQWARKVADSHGPVVAIWQADASAEGVEWMDQSQLYGSKTGVQGEADVQLMIGSSHEPGRQLERYISVVKNKLPSSKETDPKLRHGKFTVDMDAERGRFIGRMT